VAPAPADIPEIPEDILDRVRALCLALPEVTVRVDLARNATRSTSYAYYIRQRSFCLLVARPLRSGQVIPLLVIRAGPQEQAALLAHGRPFFPSRAGGNRVVVALGPWTDWTEIRELVTESYRLLAPKKLTALLDNPPAD
jgi:hypothetical protein